MKWIRVHTRKVNLSGMEISFLGYIIGMKKLVGQPITGRLIVYRNKVFAGYDLRKDDKWLEKVILENYRKKNLKFFRKIINQFPALSKRLIEISDQIYNLPLETLSNQKLAYLFEEFRRAISLLFPYVVIPRKIDEFLMRKVKDEFLTCLSKNLKRKGGHYFSLMLVPQIKTKIKDEEAEILKLALKFKKFKSRKLNLNVLKRRNPPLYKLIEQHHQKYSWLGVYFCGEEDPLSLDYYLSTIKNLIQGPENEIKSRLRELATKQSLPKLKLPRELKDILDIIKNFSVLNFKTGELWSYSGFRLIPLLREIANRSNLKIEEVQYLLFEEIIDFLEDKRRLPSRERIKKRMKFSVLLMRNGRIKLYEGKRARLFIKKELKEGDKTGLKEIKGQGVYPGKVGGKVKIVFGRKSTTRFKSGEILVTGMTSVDYIPAVKKAKAIVTDEGGITCHAAIIAREFKKPCIIGTKISTQVLRDGQMVEVDAERGIVKVLNNKKE